MLDWRMSRKVLGGWVRGARCEPRKSHSWLSHESTQSRGGNILQKRGASNSFFLPPQIFIEPLRGAQSFDPFILPYVQRGPSQGGAGRVQSWIPVPQQCTS